MKKELKNYLPFHFGCELLVIKTKDVVTFDELKSDSRWPVWTRNKKYCDKSGAVANGFRFKEIKPILRPLDTITEAEKHRFINECGLEPEDISCIIKSHDTFFPGHEMSYGTAHLTNIANWAIAVKFLLDLQFDIFELIASGLAISSNKIENV